MATQLTARQQEMQLAKDLAILRLVTIESVPVMVLATALGISRQAIYKRMERAETALKGRRQRWQQHAMESSRQAAICRKRSRRRRCQTNPLSPASLLERQSAARKSRSKAVRPAGQREQRQRPSRGHQEEAR